MSNITSSKKYIQVEETRFRSAVSESLEQKIGGSINYLNDQDTTNTAAIAALDTRLDLTYKLTSTTRSNAFSQAVGSEAAPTAVLTAASNEIIIGHFHVTPGFATSWSASIDGSSWNIATRTLIYSSAGNAAGTFHFSFTIPSGLKLYFGSDTSPWTGNIIYQTWTLNT